MSHVITRGLAGIAIAGAALHLVLTFVMSRSDRDWSYGARPAESGWDAITITASIAVLALLAWRTGGWTGGLRAIGIPATGVALVLPVLAVVFAADAESQSRLDMFNTASWVLIVTVTVAALVLAVRAPWSATSRLALVPACAVLPAGLLMTALDDSAGWYALQIVAALAVAIPAARALAASPRRVL